MCEWGTSTEMQVTIAAHLSHTGKEYRKLVGIDSCIAHLVHALNDAGIATLASCCGHGKHPGNIALADGRELIIAPDFATARQVDAAFPPIFEEGAVSRPKRCPRCNSWNPTLHPAVQHQGEVHICPDPWHGPLDKRFVALNDHSVREEER